jgi:hypothetical protein
MMTADIPGELRSILRRIPDESRNEWMNKAFAEADNGAIEATKERERIANEDTPTDRLSWIQRRNAARKEFPLSAHARFSNSIREQMDAGPTSTTFSHVFSILMGYAERVKLQHGQDAADELLEATASMLASTVRKDGVQYAFEPGHNGLAVGSIQSGKSASFIGLSSAMIDMGVKVVVVLSGVTDKLREQTQSRLEKDLLRHEPSLFSPTTKSDLSSYRKGNEKSENLWFQTQSACVQHLRKEGSAIFIVTKKNYATLRAVNTLLGHLQGKGLLGSRPALIIDDECDHASINTRSELFDGVTNLNGPRIHKDIVGIRTGYPAVYWGYTATPQAQVFQHPKDPLAPQCVHVLESHKHYLGPIEVFHDERHLLVDPCQVTDMALPSRGADAVALLRQMKKPPESLVKAMMNHAISGALHHLQPRKFMPHKNRHSMMVHVIREIDGQNEVYRLVEKAKRAVRQMLNSARVAPVDIVDESISRFRSNRIELRPEHIKMPSKADIIEAAINVVKTSDLRLLNSRSDDVLDYDDPNTPDNIIAIGGDILSRGLTIEGLRTTYFIRQPSKPVIDSTLQSARWFGPLRDDKDLISIHLPPELAERFAKIAMSDAQLRDEFRHITEEGLPVAEANISYHPGFLATRKRKNMVSIRNANDRISIKAPWIGSDEQATAALCKSLKDLDISSPQILNTDKGDLQGVLFKCTLEEMETFIEAQKSSISARSDFDDALERIKILNELDDAPPAHIVIRNGSSAERMDTELPKPMRGLGLHRVIRRSRDGLRIDQVASGRSPGQSIYTSDWYVDGFRPKTPTAAARGWRTTRDPVMLVVYVLGEHNREDSRLGGDGPWICYAFQFPHSGPGGSLAVNKHRSGVIG